MFPPGRPSGPGRRGPGRWKSAASTPGWVALSCAVDAVEQERAERGVGRDVGGDEPDGGNRDHARERAGRAATGAGSPGRPYTALGVEHVAGLPDRLDQRRAERVELAAQVAHVGLDDVRVPAEVVAPHVLEDLALREDAARVEQEEAEQVELGRGELDGLVASGTPRAGSRRGRGRRSGARRPGASLPVRRRIACTRATISARLNGFVT